MQHRLERLWARLSVRLLGITMQVSGLENFDRDGSYVVVPLHEGFADAVALFHLPLGLRFVTREELAGWKVLGSYLEASGQIAVDPEKPVSAYRKLLEGAQGVFAEGDSLVVFAQGTILGIESAFSEGAFRLAERENRPLLPVVLTGSHRVWDHPFSPRVRFGQTIRMEVLPPIEPEDARSSFASLPDRMRRAALAGSPPARRFVPERDGWWDDYRYEIDPAFPELAERVRRHRAAGAEAKLS
jgi:1-acyl-sn-glycerol-3-phosphate acyltransferase